MPRKVRQLRADLRRAGFVLDPQRGKGSHTWWTHTLAPGNPVNLAGQDGDDAQRYQEHAVRAALAAVAQARHDAGR